MRNVMVGGMRAFQEKCKWHDSILYLFPATAGAGMMSLRITIGAILLVFDYSSNYY